MWIQAPTHLRRLYNAEVMEEPIEFNSNGTAQVTQEIGEQLVAHYDGIDPA